MTVDVVGPLETAPAAGGAGVATGTIESVVDSRGLIMAVYVEYKLTPPGTSDFVLATKGTDPVAPAQTVLTLTNANTDGWFYPRLSPHDPNGNVLAGIYDYFPIADRIVGTLAQANDADYIKFWLEVWKR